MNKFRLLLFLIGWLSLMHSSFPDEIKTIDGDIITGEVVDVDEEYLSVRQSQDRISFIQWGIISLISRDKEIIIVNCDETQKKFSILKTANSLSAKDINLTTTDKISAIYPRETLTNRPFFLSENKEEQSVHTDPSNTPGIKGVSQGNTVQQKKSWSGNVDAGLTIQRGNREALTTSTKTAFSWERIRDKFYFNSLILFDTTNGVKSADEQQGTFKYERKFFKERLYSFHQESVEHDEIEKLNLRSITSSGVGYRFIDRENLKHKSEVGPSFTYERFRNDITQTNPGLRIGNYLDWQIYNSTTLYGKLDYLPELDNLIKWRLESDVGLRQKLNKNLSWNLSWINQYDSDPNGEGVSNNDATILSTIGYNF